MVVPVIIIVVIIIVVIVVMVIIIMMLMDNHRRLMRFNHMVTGYNHVSPTWPMKSTDLVPTMMSTVWHNPMYYRSRDLTGVLRTDDTDRREGKGSSE